MVGTLIGSQVIGLFARHNRYDLAVMSMRCGEREAACRHLGAADAVFEELDVPRYRARVAALAAEWGVGPTENR